MSVTSWALDKWFGKRVASDTRQYLAEVAMAPVQASRRRTSAWLRALQERPGPRVVLGETDGEPVSIPLSDLVESHGLMTGGSGSGKTMATLLIVDGVLEHQDSYPAGFAVVDGAKSDLFLGTLWLIQRKLADLSDRDPAMAAKFRRRIRIIDFAATEVVTEFNLFARWPGAEPEAFAGHQVDLLLDVLPDGDALKLAAAALKSLAQIFSGEEIGMSVIDLIRALSDEPFLNSVLAGCGNRALVETLQRQLATVSRSTRAAVQRRLEALVSSQSVSRMLAGAAAPDFRRLQDEGCFVAVNCAGPNISGSLTRFLNTLAVSHFCRSIYGRRRPEVPFVVFADEAQDLFASPVMREHLSDAGRLARRYGTHFSFVTQNLSAAISDARLLSLLHTNVGWTWSGRGDPADCAFLKGMLPATARRPRPKQNPFEETRYYSPAEEQSLLLEEVANLPSRVAYLLFKGRSPEAIRIRTRDLDIPQGRELEEATLAIRRDPTIGQRLSRREYDRRRSERERKRMPEGRGELETEFAEAYQRTRRGGGKKTGA
jgi:hypothetical protein